MEFGENGAVITEQNINAGAEEKASSIHAFADGPKSLSGLFRWTTFALTGYCIVEALNALISIFLVWLYLPSTVVPFNLQTLETIDVGIAAAGISQLVLFWVSAFLVGRCTYRAMKNLYTINSKHAEMSPGWAVGWYVIPIASLFKPAEGMSQIVHGTRHAVGETSPSNSRIPLWWTFWLLTNISASISGQLSKYADDLPLEITALALGGFSSLFGVLSAWALLRVWRPVVRDQELIKHGGVAHIFD